MVEAAAEIIVELVPTIVAGVTDLATTVLAASVRPWRYLLSSSYRARARAEFERRSTLARGWYMAQGTLALLMSLVLLGLLAFLLASSHGSHRSTKVDVVCSWIGIRHCLGRN